MYSLIVLEPVWTIQLLAEFIPSEGFEGESAPCLSPSSWWGLPIVMSSGLLICHSHLRLYLHVIFYGCTGEGAHIAPVHLHVNNPISKQGHVLGYWGLGLHHIFLGRHCSTHNRRIWPSGHREKLKEKKINKKDYQLSDAGMIKCSLWSWSLLR